MTNPTTTPNRRKKAKNSQTIVPTGPTTPSVAPGFLVERLTPRKDVVPVQPDDLEAQQLLTALVAATEQVGHHAYADATRRTYQWHVDKWFEWCQAQGANAAEVEPALVAQHLTAMAAVLDPEDPEGLARDEEGKPLRGQLRPVTLDQRLQALNKLADELGVARPGNDYGVKQQMRAIRRIWGVTPEERKAALRMNEMRRLLAINDGISYERQRDRAIVALRRQGLTPGQLASLPWVGVTLRHRSVELEAEKPTRAQGTITVELAAEADPMLCPVSALRDLRDVSSGKGSVFTHNGKPMTRQGIAAVVQRLTAGERTDEAIASAVQTSITPTLLQLRNRAMLLTGWYAALRRSNIVERLNWGDLAVEGGEWEVTLSITKTNQEGGRNLDHNWLSLSEDPAWPCAASAMTAWHAAVTKELGGDPMVIARNQPVFPAMDRHSNLRRTRTGRMMRLDGEAVNVLVKGLCEKAGLDPTQYGAHSLRAGFVTEALTDNKLTIAEVQEVTHHKKVDVLMTYHRRINAQSSNPTKKLWGKPPAA